MHLLLATVKEDMVNNLKNEELVRLANASADILKKSRAENTNKKYESAFRKWEKWSKKFDEIKTFPIKKIHVVLYLSMSTQRYA